MCKITSSSCLERERNSGVEQNVGSVVKMGTFEETVQHVTVKRPEIRLPWRETRIWESREVKVVRTKNYNLRTFQISSMSSGENDLFIMGHDNKVHCHMIIDTRANVIIIRTNLAQKNGKNVIWMPPYFFLQTVTGDKNEVNGNVNLNITFRGALTIRWHMRLMLVTNLFSY